jgi:hypothetical protein
VLLNVKTQSESPKGTLRDQFDRLGFVVIQGLLTSTEAAHYRVLLQQKSGRTDADFDAKSARKKGWTLADGATKDPDFWPLILNKRLIGVIREVIGADAKYTQHSDLHVHHGTVGWHRDSKDRNFGLGSDWDESKEPYRVARVAIYLQTYEESGSKLGVIGGSHRRESAITRTELRAANLLRRRLGRNDVLPPVLSARASWIQTQPGDCIIFDQRALHTGNFIRGPKYAVFLSYGADNAHSRAHRLYYIENRKELGYGDYPAELAAKLREENLFLKID